MLDFNAQLEQLKPIIELQNILESIKKEKYEEIKSTILDSMFFTQEKFFKLSFLILDSVRCCPENLSLYVGITSNLCNHHEKGVEFKKSFIKTILDYELQLSHKTFIELLVSRDVLDSEFAQQFHFDSSLKPNYLDQSNTEKFITNIQSSSLPTENLFYQLIQYHCDDLIINLPTPSPQMIISGFSYALKYFNLAYLSNYANSIQTNEFETTISLDFALKKNYVEPIQLLLSSSRINIDWKISYTPKYLIHSSTGNIDILEHLLQLENPKSDIYFISAARCISPTIGPQIVHLLSNLNFPGLNKLVDNLSPLNYALELGHENTALALIDIGADIFSSDSNCLIEAISYGLDEAVKRLLSIYKNKNIDITQYRTRGGLSAIQLAADRNLSNIISLLLDPSLFYDGNGFNSSLYLAEGFLEAAKYDYKELIPLFTLHPSFDVNATLSSGRSLLSEITKLDNTEYIDILKKDHLLRYDPHALISAIKSNLYTMVLYLMNFEDFDINLIDPITQTPALIQAVLSNRIEIVSIFFSIDSINPNIKDSNGCTPLSLSISFHRTEIFEYLLSTLSDTNASKKVNINAQNNDGLTPLMTAVLVNDLNTASILLSLDTLNVNAFDKSMETALFKAISVKNEDMANLLLSDERVNIHLRNKEGLTPLMIAIQNDLIQIVSRLINSGAKITDQALNGTRVTELPMSSRCRALLNSLKSEQE